jgi:Spy/CpxP family protein refolding chaperone
MKKIDLKQRMREVKFTTEHVLTPDQRDKLIREKLERAERFLRFDQVQKERTSQP